MNGKVMQFMELFSLESLIYLLQKSEELILLAETERKANSQSPSLQQSSLATCFPAYFCSVVIKSPLPTLSEVKHGCFIFFVCLERSQNL